jgi:ribosomal protein L44E
MRHSCCVNACCVRGENCALLLALRFSGSAQTAPNLTVPSLLLPLRSGFETEPVSMVQRKRASAGLNGLSEFSSKYSPSTPLGFVLAPPKELTAYCSACASAYNPLAARLLACTARSLQHAQRSSSERNPTESSTPLGFVLAPPKELTAYCSACASAYNPLAARLPARIARSLAHVNRSSSERNPTESTALLAQLMELGTCDSDCARPTCHHVRPPCMY